MNGAKVEKNDNSTVNIVIHLERSCRHTIKDRPSNVSCVLATRQTL